MFSLIPSILYKKNDLNISLTEWVFHPEIFFAACYILYDSVITVTLFSAFKKFSSIQKENYFTLQELKRDCTTVKFVSLTFGSPCELLYSPCNDSLLVLMEGNILFLSHKWLGFCRYHILEVGLCHLMTNDLFTPLLKIYKNNLAWFQNQHWCKVFYKTDKNHFLL